MVIQMTRNKLLLLACLPVLAAGCASPEATAKKEAAQVSCNGQAPRVGTHIVRKSDCVPLSPEEAAEQRQKFEAMQQAQEIDRARREGAPPATR